VSQKYDVKHRARIAGTEGSRRLSPRPPARPGGCAGRLFGATVSAVNPGGPADAAVTAAVTLQASVLSTVALRLRRRVVR